MQIDGEIGSFSADTGNGNNPSADPITIYTIPDLVSFVNRTRNNYFIKLQDADMLSKMYPEKDEDTGEILPI